MDLSTLSPVALSTLAPGDLFHVPNMHRRGMVEVRTAERMTVGRTPVVVIETMTGGAYASTPDSVVWVL